MLYPQLPNVALHQHCYVPLPSPSSSSSSLAELPECRLQLASNRDVVDQFIAIMLTPTYKYIASLVTVAGLLCLSYSPETHVHLARREVISGAMVACRVRRKWYNINSEEMRLDCQLLS